MVEADESDGTHLELPLYGTILTNVEVDHLDHYGTLRRDRRRLRPLPRPDRRAEGAVRRRPGRRRPGRPPRRHHLRHSTPAPTTGPSTSDRRAAAQSLHRRARTASELGEVDLPLRGVHNVRNATGAVAMADAVGVPFEAAARGAGPLRRRRPPLRHPRRRHGGITFVDDYAHLPDRDRRRARRRGRRAATAGDAVVAVFQPNRYNRMAVLSPEYRDAFVDADVAVLTDIYPSGQAPIPGVTGKLVVERRARRPSRAARSVWLPQRGRPRRRSSPASSAPATCASRWAAATSPRCPTRCWPGCAETGAGRRSTTASSDAPSSGGRRRSARSAERDVPLGPLTTYRVGGPAALFVRAESRRRPRPSCAVALAESGLPVLVVGRGSNLLVADAGFAGPGRRARRVRADDRGRRRRAWSPAARSALPVLARQTVGRRAHRASSGRSASPVRSAARVRMNAGGHGSDMAASLVGVRVFDLRSGEDGEVPAERARPALPGSDLADHQVVVDGDASRLAPGDRAASEARDRRDRALAARAPARRPERRLGVRQPGARSSCRPARSSTASGCAGCASARPQVSRRSTPTSSRPTRAAAPTTCAPSWTRCGRGCSTERGIALRSEIRLVGFDAHDDGIADREVAS